MRLSCLTRHVRRPRKNDILRVRTVLVASCKDSTQNRRFDSVRSGLTVTVARGGLRRSSSEPSATVIEPGSHGISDPSSCSQSHQELRESIRGGGCSAALYAVDHSLGPARLPNTVACVWGLMCMLVHASDIVCGPLVAPRHARPTVHQYTSSIHMGGRRAAHAVGSPPAGPAASRAAVRATPTPRPPRRRSTRLSSQHSGWKFIRLFLSGHLPGVAIHVVELRAAALLRVLVGLARALRRGR